MKKDVQGIVLLLVGVMVLRLALGDQFLFYVAEGMKPFLLASSVVLLVLGGYALWDSWREGNEPADEQVHARHEADLAVGEILVEDGHGHDHSRGPRIAYLLLLPVLAVYVVAPSALGAFSAERQTTTSTAPAVDLQLPALPEGQISDMPLRDYVVRSVWDGGKTLQGREVRMVGFVTPDPEGGWWLTRMAMSCCAADAQASRIKVTETEDLPADAWVEVTGRWVEGGGVADPKAVPVLEATSVTPVPAPRNPYE